MLSEKFEEALGTNQGLKALLQWMELKHTDPRD